MVAAPAAAAPLRPLALTANDGRSACVSTGGEVALDGDPVPTTVVPFQATGYRYRCRRRRRRRGLDAAGLQRSPGSSRVRPASGPAAAAPSRSRVTRTAGEHRHPPPQDHRSAANTTDIVVTGGIDNDTFVYWNGQLIGQRSATKAARARPTSRIPCPRPARHGLQHLPIRAAIAGPRLDLDVRVTAAARTRSRRRPRTPDPTSRRRRGRDRDRSMAAARRTRERAADLRVGAGHHRSARAITLSSSTSATPAFQSLDDGTYAVHPHRQQRHATATDEVVVVTVTQRETGAVGPGRPGLREERRADHDDASPTPASSTPTRRCRLGRRLGAADRPGRRPGHRAGARSSRRTSTPRRQLQRVDQRHRRRRRHAPRRR